MSTSIMSGTIAAKDRDSIASLLADVALHIAAALPPH
jgi:hypothetical protein